MASGRSKRGAGSRREHWQQVLARQRASGLSIKAFCARDGVSYQSFFLWKRKFAGEAAAGALTREKVTFAPVTVVSEAAMHSPGGHIEIELPGDRRVRVQGPVDKQALSDVLAVLGAGRAGAC
jgi:hypothetical protein